MLSFRLTPQARAQFDFIDEWWRANRTASPDLFCVELERAIAVTRSNPSLGTGYPHESLPNLRRLLLRRTRFHVYYVVDDDTATVVAIWNAIAGRGPQLP